MHIKSQLEVCLYTGCSVHFHPSLFTRPSLQLATPPPNSVYLGRHWYQLHDKMNQAFPLRFCILQVIKNWMAERPGNEARICLLSCSLKLMIQHLPSVHIFPANRIENENLVVVLISKAQCWSYDETWKTSWWAHDVWTVVHNQQL